MASENELIQRVFRKFPSARRDLRVGIGDDAAVLRPNRGLEWVVTTDAFLEGIHFLRDVCPPRAAGHKAIARATSDIAAMGARPRYFFLTLGLPEDCTGKWLDEFLAGMGQAARRYGLILAGGDTTKYSAVIASLTVMGEVAPGRAVLRSGGKPGNLLCVSGVLGEAQLGLELTLRKLHKRRRRPNLLRKHFYPEPRLALGEWLANHRMATSMIDVSDGLSTDLAHICQSSGVGARLWEDKIPAVNVPPEFMRPGAGFTWSPLHKGPGSTRRRQSGFGASATWSPLNKGLAALELALHGGEDYELLFTVPKKLAARLPRKLEGIPITVIGEITRPKKILLVDNAGRSKPLQPRGWDPFRTRGRR